MDITNQQNIKAIYRITGTPENFLTALRYGVWGFIDDPKMKIKWEKLNSGDIIFFHSKGADSFFIKNSRSCVIGFGVVGNNFYIDNSPLWIDEYLKDIKYPFKFGFSELYFFEDIPINDSWDSTSLAKKEITSQIIQKVLRAGIPLSDLNGFPHMGSYSAIKDSAVKSRLLGSKRSLSYFKGVANEENVTKPTEFRELNSSEESLRYSTTLTVFDDIKERIISNGIREYSANLDLLSLAEKSHYNIIKNLGVFLQDHGYRTFYNNHVDLFAYKGKTSMLIEAKSIENKNFKTQSRKGIVQLFEYNYFEIQKFKSEKNLVFADDHKLLVTSDIPKDIQYVKFINSLHIKTAAIKDKKILSYGDSVDFEKL